MTTPASVDERLTAPTAAAALPDDQWVALHVPRYQAVIPRYAEYARFLEDVLNQICARLAPLGIVSVRAKSAPSFAEKILRKRSRYVDAKDPQRPDPLVRLTDLCGGRIIVHTAEQVHNVCDFIERHFTIDKANSEDVSQRLKPTEFGYRSVHYVVQVAPEQLAGGGMRIAVPSTVLGPVCPDVPQPLGLKAEIQVRTLLEHAAADIAHDLIYKTDVKIPDRIRRHFARINAMLEAADREFSDLIGSLAALNTDYGAYIGPAAATQEMHLLSTVLACCPDNVDQAVKLARLALSTGHYETAEKVLRPFQDTGHAAVQAVLGRAICGLHWRAPQDAAYEEGLCLLEASCAQPHPSAEMLCALGEAWAPLDDEKARQGYERAASLDATEPLSLCRFLEFEVAHLGNDDAVRLGAPLLRGAVTRCLAQIEGRVNLPYAWSCLAVFRLLKGDSFAALDALAHVICLCGVPPASAADDAGGCGQADRLCAGGRALLRLRETLRRLAAIREKLAGYEWFERMLTLGLAVRLHDSKALKQVKALASWTRDGQSPHFTATDRPLILSGGCGPDVTAAMDAARPDFLDACRGLSFVLLSGGTAMGISGISGDIAAASEGRVRAFGYLPRSLPFSVRPDEAPGRFTRLVTSPGTHFTPLDPLQGWTDLVAAGIAPRRVKAVGYCSRSISRVEIVTALALGAQVALLEGKGVPPDRVFADPAWMVHPGLVRLPLDRMTLRAFLLTDGLPVSAADRTRLEKAARMAHEDYRRSATPTEPSTQRWRDLLPDLKLSNYHQVAYWEQMLRERGIAVRALTEADLAHPPLKLEDIVGEEGIRELAEMEHGRWNMERFSRGWRYAEQRDVARKLSPYLVPWKDVPEHIRDYDTVAIRGLPEKLREADLELDRL